MSPVDIVYLWVDSADVQWRKRRQHAYADWVAKTQTEADAGQKAAFEVAFRDNVTKA